MFDEELVKGQEIPGRSCQAEPVEESCDRLAQSFNQAVPCARKQDVDEGAAPLIYDSHAAHWNRENRHRLSGAYNLDQHGDAVAGHDKTIGKSEEALIWVLA